MYDISEKLLHYNMFGGIYEKKKRKRKKGMMAHLT